MSFITQNSFQSIITSASVFYLNIFRKLFWISVKLGLSSGFSAQEFRTSFFKFSSHTKSSLSSTVGRNGRPFEGGEVTQCKISEIIKFLNLKFENFELI